MIERNRIQVNDTTTLEPMALRHAPPLFQLVEKNRDHLKVWLTWVDRMATEEHFNQFTLDAEQRWTNGSDYGFVILYQNQLAGRIGIYGVDAQNRAGSIGYWIGKSFEGKGIITSSCLHIIRFGMEELKLNRIEIRCATGNTRSAAIAERLGCTREGTLRQAEWVNGKFLDLDVYSLLRDEWQKLNS